jgi:hypothetical protein
MSEQTVELRLTGTAVTTLADNAHLPGWPGAVDPDKAAGDPTTNADYHLDQAAARWYRGSVSRSVGYGRIQVGGASPADARLILEYLESVAGALCASEDAGARAEGRAVGGAVDQAVSHLRRHGVPVRAVERGAHVDYFVGEDIPS